MIYYHLVPQGSLAIDGNRLYKTCSNVVNLYQRHPCTFSPVVWTIFLSTRVSTRLKGYRCAGSRTSREATIFQLCLSALPVL